MLQFVITLFIAFSVFPLAVHAQLGSSSSTSWEIGLQAGSLLPNRIRGVREIVPGWAPSVAIPTRAGTVQIGGFFGRGNGIVYNALSFDYRIELLLEGLPLHFLLGMHADEYEGLYGKSKILGGWHFGGGTTQAIAGPISLRGDFRSRYGPGRSLEILVGLVYGF